MGFCIYVPEPVHTHSSYIINMRLCHRFCMSVVCLCVVQWKCSSTCTGVGGHYYKTLKMCYLTKKEVGYFYIYLTNGNKFSFDTKKTGVVLTIMNLEECKA